MCVCLVSTGGDGAFCVAGCASRVLGPWWIQLVWEYLLGHTSLHSQAPGSGDTNMNNCLLFRLGSSILPPIPRIPPCVCRTMVEKMWCKPVPASLPCVMHSNDKQSAQSGKSHFRLVSVIFPAICYEFNESLVSNYLKAKNLQDMPHCSGVVCYIQWLNRGSFNCRQMVFFIPLLACANNAENWTHDLLYSKRALNSFGHRVPPKCAPTSVN